MQCINMYITVELLLYLFINLTENYYMDDFMDLLLFYFQAGQIVVTMNFHCVAKQHVFFFFFLTNSI